MDAPAERKGTRGDGERVAEGGDDAELMRRVQGGDEAALGALMERWELPVKRVVARIVFNASEAEEVAQETLVRVWTQREKFRAGAAFRPWIFSIAINLARNRLRWWRTRPGVSLQDWSESEMSGARGQRPDGGSEVLERAERAAAVSAAVAELPVKLREALTLFHYEEMSQGEIATALGCSVKAVEVRVARAREKLRGALSGWV